MRIVLKMAQRVENGDAQVGAGKDQAAGYVGNGPERVCLFESKDVVDLSVQGVNLDKTTIRPSHQQNGINLDTLITSSLHH